MTHRVLTIICIGFMSGIAIRSFFDTGLALPIFLVSMSITCVLVIHVSQRTVPLQHSHILLLAILLSSVALGIFRLQIDVLFHGPKTEVAREITLSNSKSLMQATIVDEPDIRENSARYIVEINKIKIDNTRDYEADSADNYARNDATYDTAIDTQIVKLRALVVSELYPTHDYGDEISIAGNLEKPKNFTADDGREFDYVAYLAKNRIHYVINNAKLSSISKGNGNMVNGVLLDIKDNFMHSIERVIPEPHASLMGGLLLGAKRSLGTELKNKFRRAGLIHIVVLSGYNLTIVADAFMRVLAFLPRMFGLMMGGVSIVLFALMVGGGATVVRASIMALLILLARGTGRTYGMARALFFAGFIMVLHNPLILVFDVSFQLSFVATFSLIVLAPILENHLVSVIKHTRMRQIIVETVSTQLFVLPLILYYMGDVSLVALPVNILTLFIIPLTMFFGFFTGVVGLVSYVLAMPFALISTSLLGYILWIVDFFATPAIASLRVPSFSFVYVVLFHLIYWYFIAKLQIRTLRQHETLNSAKR